jgi:hypothetical protein
MATTRVKEYTKTINGKLVFVPAHDQTVHHALDRDFEALLQHPKVQALAPPKPKAPEPDASKIPDHLLTDVDQDFQAALPDIAGHSHLAHIPASIEPANAPPSNVVPEPSATTPPASPWQPTPDAVHNVLVYHNT